MFGESVAPRQLKLFHSDFGGNCFFDNIGEALEIDTQTGLPEAGENLVVRWCNPNQTAYSQLRFFHNFHIFLETGGGVPPAGEPLSRVPDEQLLSSCSMAAILAGEVHPGSYEFLIQVASDQNTKNFTTILGDALIKSTAIVPEAQLQQVQYGKFYDIEFRRSNSASNVKIVRSDIIEISKYSNRSLDFSLSVHSVPGAITKQFGKLITSQLGAAESQLRNDICNWVKDQRFYA